MLCIIAFMVDKFISIPDAEMYLTGILSHLHAALRCRVLLLDVFISFMCPCSDILSHLTPLYGRCMQNEPEYWCLDSDKHGCALYSILPDAAFRGQASGEHTDCEEEDLPDAAIAIQVLLPGHVAEFGLKRAHLLGTCRCSVMAPLCCSCAANTMVPALPSLCGLARATECSLACSRRDSG